MDNNILVYSLFLLVGTFISAISQVMLKKAALRTYDSPIKEYFNPLVISAYAIFVITTFLSILAYKGIPLSMGPVIESAGYIFVTVFGVIIFGEKINLRKIVALCLIIAGICVYSFCG